MISIASDSIMAEKKFPFSTHRSRKIEKFVQFAQKKDAFCDTIQEDSTGGRINIISIVMDAPQQIISTLSGRIGRLNGISCKVTYSKE